MPKINRNAEKLLHEPRGLLPRREPLLPNEALQTTEAKLKRRIAELRAEIKTLTLALENIIKWCTWPSPHLFPVIKRRAKEALGKKNDP